jgi:SPP1 family predicted phage head-tail adaptor
MTDPGSLDKRLIIEAPVEAPDGAGGVVRAYEAAATVWASITPDTARADVQGDHSRALVTHRIVIRNGPELSTQHRLRNGGRVFAISAFRDADGRGRFIDISAQEHVG